MIRFHPTELPGVLLVEPERFEDERGFFGRTFCRREFEEQGLPGDMVQCSISFNHRRGTLRGMHYQVAPHEEPKLVRCTRGRVLDVLIDLRPDSPTFKGHVKATLSAENRRAVYVPPGIAHGFLTLEDDCEVLYQMAEYWHPESARGVRWNDPAFGIDWPEEPTMILQRDRTYPDFTG